MQRLHQFFLGQAAIFLPYHRDPRNWVLHQFGLPIGVFGFMVALAWVEFFDLGGYTVSLATVVVVPVMVFWILADRVFGAIATVFYAVFLAVADRVAELPFDQSAAIAAGTFALGMVLQLIGHLLEDGKLVAEGAITGPMRFLPVLRTTFGTPNTSVLHNHIQLFVVPMILFATIGFSLGYKPALRAEMLAQPKVGSLER